ncbi:hypothetical protein Sta7437_1788 [Stanieria cyanosphaera PCC 7437]|uniref:Uncharacterized protein n=1 Tax=Stanieria cyanosphaera (strain ATCC 29371 / PCC 7437) TaxID=111780 RepID=K9XTE0_STAC7|nr:hypothetical protein [Stanieria cyanosphaera]AFZ35346.1 hypothetical protein Sta7437_1788 [Stanieria cyanosphaera PCC 7437]
MNPNHWLTVWLFIAIATCLSGGVGWLVKHQILKLKPIMAFSETQWQFMRIWVKVALVIGVILPTVMLVVFWERSLSRQFFSCYLLAVVVQLTSEISFSRWLCPSVVVTIGTVYTGFRIWQLWSGINLVSYPQPWLGFLWLVLLFWVANLIMLLTMAFPSIMPESKKNLVNPS